MRLERARYHSTSTLASTSASESASCYRQIIKYIAHLWRRSKRRLLRRYRAYRSRKRDEKAARVEQHCQLSRRAVRKVKRKRRIDPDCPKHGSSGKKTENEAMKQQRQMTESDAGNHRRSNSLRVPPVRINDGPPLPPISSSSPKMRRASVVEQRSSPFLSPRGMFTVVHLSSYASHFSSHRQRKSVSNS